jgi:WD domain, G-beta repeat
MSLRLLDEKDDGARRAAVMMQQHFGLGASYGDPIEDSEKVFSVSVHPIYPLLAIGLESAQVKIFDMYAGQFVEVLPQPGEVRSVAFSSCGERLAVAGSSNSQEFFNISVWTIDSMMDPTRADMLGAFPDYYEFRLMTDDTHLTEAKWAPSMRHILHQGTIRCLAFRPTPRGAFCSLLASGSDDETVRLWNLNNMTREVYREQHNGEVMAVEFSQNGHVMATCARDGLVRVWRFESLISHKIEQTIQFEIGHGYIPLCLNFFPDDFEYRLDRHGNRVLREFLVAVGSNRGLHILLAKMTHIPLNVDPTDFDREATNPYEREQFDLMEVERERAVETLLKINDSKYFYDVYIACAHGDPEAMHLARKRIGAKLKNAYSRAGVFAGGRSMHRDGSKLCDADFRTALNRLRGLAVAVVTRATFHEHYRQLELARLMHLDSIGRISLLIIFPMHDGFDFKSLAEEKNAIPFVEAGIGSLDRIEGNDIDVVMVEMFEWCKQAVPPDLSQSYDFAHGWRLREGYALLRERLKTQLQDTAICTRIGDALHLDHIAKAKYELRLTESQERGTRPPKPYKPPYTTAKKLLHIAEVEDRLTPLDIDTLLYEIEQLADEGLVTKKLLAACETYKDKFDSPLPHSYWNNVPNIVISSPEEGSRLPPNFHSEKIAFSATAMLKTEELGTADSVMHGGERTAKTMMLDRMDTTTVMNIASSDTSELPANYLEMSQVHEVTDEELPGGIASCCVARHIGTDRVRANRLEPTSSDSQVDTVFVGTLLSPSGYRNGITVDRTAEDHELRQVHCVVLQHVSGRATRLYRSRVSRSPIITHRDIVSGIAVPSRSLRVAMMRNKMLSYPDNEHLVCTASLDETVQQFKYNFRPQRRQTGDIDWIPGRVTREPLLVERAMTDFKVNQEIQLMDKIRLARSRVDQQAQEEKEQREREEAQRGVMRAQDLEREAKFKEAEDAFAIASSEMEVTENEDGVSGSAAGGRSSLLAFQANATTAAGIPLTAAEAAAVHRERGRGTGAESADNVVASSKAIDRAPVDVGAVLGNVQTYEDLREWMKHKHGRLSMEEIEAILAAAGQVGFSAAHLTALRDDLIDQHSSQLEVDVVNVDPEKRPDIKGKFADIYKFEKRAIKQNNNKAGAANGANGQENCVVM